MQAGLGDALHHSTLTLSSWANRANSVHLESPCCLWAGFGDHQEFTPTVNASESLLSNTGHASCECLIAPLELSLGPVCGTREVNPRVLAVVTAVTC